MFLLRYTRPPTVIPKLEPYRHSKDRIKAELDLSNFATKSELKSNRY